MKHNLAVEPGSTKQRQTGDWRNFRPVFDDKKCIGCGLCSRICPEGCVFASTEKALQGKITYEADLDYCKGCGLCAEECPVKAIDMIQD